MLSNKQPPQKLPWKFIALTALFMSLAALTIDSMLPALPSIAESLQAQHANDAQLIISTVFLGMGVGLLFVGPFSDSYGRKAGIYVGMVIFIMGCLLSIFATDFDTMLVGRFLQGLGASSCRVVTIAMIRDRFEGNMMAKIMSLTMIIFIFVPALAPGVGQLILFVAEWRMIFVFILCFGLACTLWLYFGEEETLLPEKRLPFTLKTIINGIVETLKNSASRGYIFSGGLIFACLVGYLTSSQQILQEQYHLGDYFSLVFAVIALGIGLASYANTRWLDRYSMETISQKALVVLCVVSAIFLPFTLWYSGHPPLSALLVYFVITFFCFGLLFGNLNTLAIQPLGHIAGVASSVIGSLKTLLSFVLGKIVGESYDGTTTPLVTGFFILSLCALIIVFYTTRNNQDT